MDIIKCPIDLKNESKKNIYNKLNSFHENFKYYLNMNRETRTRIKEDPHISEEDKNILDNKLDEQHNICCFEFMRVQLAFSDALDYYTINTLYRWLKKIKKENKKDPIYYKNLNIFCCIFKIKSLTEFKII